jgi:ribokinase
LKAPINEKDVKLRHGHNDGADRHPVTLCVDQPWKLQEVSMTGKVLIVGSLNMDLDVFVPRLPQTGETILGGTFATIPGGKGANQAVAAARMGAAVAMIGRLGDDDYGRTLRQVAAQDGIEMRYLQTDPKEPTGIALITVDEEGRNTIVVVPGANRTLSARHIQAAEEAFSTADVLVAQLEIQLETVTEAVRLATGRGIPVVLNPAPARSLPTELLSKVNFLIPNEGEALHLAEADSLDIAIQKLLRLGVRNLIITLGEQGVLLATPEGRVRFPAHQVEAIDTVAAGDAFVGAFAAGIAEGIGIEDAIKLGNAAAAVSVTRRGAQPSLPHRLDVDHFLRVSR